MRNKVGLKDLFGENRKAIKNFLEWIKEAEDLIEFMEIFKNKLLI